MRNRTMLDEVESPRRPGKDLVRLEQIARFFDGLDLLEPGVVPCSRWRPDISPLSGQLPPVDEFCGIARKP